jgi:hypothetical protein
MKRGTIGAIVGGMLGLCATSTVFGPRAVHALQIAVRGAAGEAVVTDVRRRRTCAVSYAFQAGGREYRANEASCPAEKGDRRRVHYLPDDPSVSTLRTPFGAFMYAVAPILLVSPWCGLTGWALFRRSNDGRPGARERGPGR